MIKFKTNKISLDTDNIGEQLRQARRNQNIELEQAARELNINLKYLKALESGHLEKLPAGIYRKNFLRKFAQFLKLNADEFMDIFNSQTEDKTEQNQKNLFSKNLYKEFFTYCELLKYNEDAIDKIQDAKDTKTILKIWDEMCEHYFLNYDVEIKKFNDNKKDFEKLTLKQQKETLVEMLNKNQLYVNLSEIEDSQFKVSKEDKELNKKFYGGK